MDYFYFHDENTIRFLLNVISLFCQYSESVRHTKKALKITFPEEVNKAPVKEQQEEQEERQ